MNDTLTRRRGFVPVDEYSQLPILLALPHTLTPVDSRFTSRDGSFLIHIGPWWTRLDRRTCLDPESRPWRVGSLGPVVGRGHRHAAARRDQGHRVRPQEQRDADRQSNKKSSQRCCRELSPTPNLTKFSWTLDICLLVINTTYSSHPSFLILYYPSLCTVRTGYSKF